MAPKPPPPACVRNRLLASSTRPGNYSRYSTKSRHSGSGMASVYSDRHTASGERINWGAMTAAHRTLPFDKGHRGQQSHGPVRSGAHQRSRSLCAHGRVIDLSPAAARAIGVNGRAVSLKLGGCRLACEPNDGTPVVSWFRRPRPQTYGKSGWVQDQGTGARVSERGRPLV
jgi:Lytic transglycolase